MAHQQRENGSQFSASYSVVNQDDDVDAPPDYEAASCSQTAATDVVTEQSHDGVNDEKVLDKLPSYELATNLPSYNDFQEIKEYEARQEVIDMFFGTAKYDESYVDGVAIGSDCVFIFAFILAFFFNWLGFFIGYCIMLSLAGRYGAVSGFGLSVVNWLLYVKFSKEGQKYMVTNERIILWWFFLVFAGILTLKGLVNWFKARRLLQLTPEQRQNERLLVLY